MRGDKDKEKSKNRNSNNQRRDNKNRNRKKNNPQNKKNNKNRNSNNQSRNNKNRNGKNRRNSKKRNINKSNDKGRLEKTIGDKKTRSKKIKHLMFYGAVYLTPYLSMDLLELPIIGHITKYMIGIPANLIGNFTYGVGEKIPILGFFIRRVAYTFWFFEPLKDLEIIGIEFFVEEGIKKAVEILIIRYWDNILDLVSGTLIPVVGGAATSYLTFMFDGEIWRIADDWGIIDKLEEKSPKLIGGLASAFILGRESNEGKSNQVQNKDKKLMTDGGRNQDVNRNNSNKRGRRNKTNDGLGSHNSSEREAGEKWGDIQKPEDSGISLPGSFNVWSIIKLLGVLGVFVVGGILITSLLGAGSGYANILGTAFGAETSAARDAGGGFLSGLLGTASSTAETGTCLASAGCFQEFLLNQSTVGAGGGTSSKNTGQTFDLRVENLKVEGMGNTIPLRIYDPGYEIPVDFSLVNKKQGEYGIEASKVDYKINIYDPGFEDEVVCGTDWLDLEKGGGQFEDKGDLLVPGESATPLSWQEEGRGSEINLRNCGLLQPQGYKDDRVIELATKYDYSTTSTLKARGMSRTYLNDESGIDNSEPAKSKAPDTPVRTYFVLTREPLQYFNTSGEYNPIPETSYFGIQTKKDNIGYHIQDFTLIDSTKTELESVDQCEDLKQGGEDNNYKISDSKWGQIQGEQDEIWLNDETEAITQMNCQFQLKGLENFNPTGEELLFTVRSEYRVKSYGKQSSFSIQNKDCTTNNCQMVKPLRGDWEKTLAAENPGDEKYWSKRYAKCKDWDDDPGCAIRKNGFENAETYDKTIDEGEIAVKTSKIPGNMLSCKVEDRDDYAGIEENELKEALDSSKVLSNEGGNWESKSKEDINCGGGGDGTGGGDGGGGTGDEVDPEDCGSLTTSECNSADSCTYNGVSCVAG